MCSTFLKKINKFQSQKVVWLFNLLKFLNLCSQKMRFLGFFSLIFVALLINLAYSRHLAPIGNQKDILASSTCNIVENVLSSQHCTQDILIVNMGNIVSIATVNTIASCIGDEHAVVISDLKVPLVEKSLRKASAIIVISDILSMVS